MNEFTELERNLHTLTRRGVVRFAFLSAARALPFLCVERDFSYWPDNEKQKYLFHIFNAVDMCMCAITVTFAATAADVSKAADDASKAADKAVAGANKAAADAHDVFMAAKASDAAAHAAFAVTAAVRTARAVSDQDAAWAAKDAYMSAVKACESSTLNPIFDTEKVNDFKRIILNDYNYVKSEQSHYLEDGISFYGDMWNNFIDDLYEIGCGYWADLYNDMFVNKFEINEEELRWRTDISDNLKQDGASAVALQIMALRSQGVVYAARESRLIIIGSAGAGKTTLARRLSGDASFPEASDTTYGVNMEIKFDFNGVKTHLWDFGGQIIYHSSHRCFLSENCVYILVVNGRDEAARDVTKINYWLDTIRVYSNNNAEVFILVNESDNRKQDIDVEALKRGHYGNLIQDVDNFNVGNDLERVSKFKEKLANHIESRGHHPIGTKDKAVMDDLRVRFEAGASVIDRIELKDIFKKHNIDVETEGKRAKRLLNILGVALSFECIADYVLDPEWISGGVYKIVDHMSKQGMQYIHKVTCYNILNNEQKYPLNRCGHIYRLMIEHRIAFECDEEGVLLVPCVASQSKPPDIDVQPSSDRLVTKIVRDDSKEFPADFFERFIYANHSDLSKYTHKGDSGYGERYTFWLTGMVLTYQDQNASAFIEISENRLITIAVWGAEKEKYHNELYRRLDSHLDEYGFIAFGEDDNDIFGDKSKSLTVHLRSDRRFEELFMKGLGDYRRFVENRSDAVDLIKVFKHAPYVAEKDNMLLNILLKL